MKKSFVLVLGLALCMGIASLNISAQRPGTSETVSLKVSFEAAMSDATECAVCGDGLGEYVDGADGVSAYLSRYGHLQFYFHGGDASLRRVLFNYSEFYPSANHPAVVPPPPSGPHSYGDFITFKVFEPYTNLQDMRVGDEPQCLMTGWTLDQGSPIWENNYHRNGSPFFDPLTSYVSATCVAEASGKCTKWELEPNDSPCNSGAVPTLVNVVKVTKPKPNKVSYQDYGLWKLPFKVTLMRK
jgi:hypothetical protein